MAVVKPDKAAPWAVIRTDQALTEADAAAIKAKFRKVQGERWPCCNRLLTATHAMGCEWRHLTWEPLP